MIIKGGNLSNRIFTLTLYIIAQVIQVIQNFICNFWNWSSAIISKIFNPIRLSPLCSTNWISIAVIIFIWILTLPIVPQQVIYKLFLLLLQIFCTYNASKKCFRESSYQTDLSARYQLFAHLTYKSLVPRLLLVRYQWILHTVPSQIKHLTAHMYILQFFLFQQIYKLLLLIKL